jgi:hypothetical protein
MDIPKNYGLELPLVLFEAKEGGWQQILDNLSPIRCRIWNVKHQEKIWPELNETQRAELTKLWPSEATHTVEFSGRYFSPCREAAHWPSIHALLMELLACPSVKTLWYGSHLTEPGIVTEELLIDHTRHYLKHRERSYPHNKR